MELKGPLVSHKQRGTFLVMYGENTSTYLHVRLTEGWFAFISSGP